MRGKTKERRAGGGLVWQEINSTRACVPVRVSIQGDKERGMVSVPENVIFLSDNSHMCVIEFSISSRKLIMVSPIFARH